MKRIPRVVLVSLALGAASALPAPPPELFQIASPPRPAPRWLKIIDQGRNDPRLKGYFTPDGVRVEIIADYPAIVNPVGMTFADDGTLYVLEWRSSGGSSFPVTTTVETYKDGSKHTLTLMRKRVRDLVKVVRDRSGKGVYDDAEVVLKEELPSSILLHDGWMYLSGQGSVRRYRRSKPGGPYDVREVIAHGFCGFHHHQVSGLTIGNDGWLYLTSGDNDNVVEGSDGSRVTVLRTGAVFRCRPDGSRMQVQSLGYRNPYRDVSFDTAFNLFHGDNDNEDGSKFTGCRLMHLAEEADFGWRLRVGSPCCVPDETRGAVFGELPGRMPAMLKTGRGAPAGLMIYNDTRLPESYRGLLFYPDVYRKLIRAYRVRPRGATFEVAEEFEFIKTDDPLFRPCQMVVGPDGAMYVCDWRTNSGGAGQLWGDGQHGRIYRLSWVGTKEHAALPLRRMDSWARLIRGNDTALLQALRNEEFSDRQQAQYELRRRGPRNRPALLDLVRDAQEPQRARVAALGILESFWNAEVQVAVVKLLDDDDADLRRLACDALALNAHAGDDEIDSALVKTLSDPELAVRRAAALAVGRVAAPGAADALVSALRFEESTDVYLVDGLVRAIERLGQPGIERLLTLADSGVERERDRVVAAFLTLRTRAGADALPTLLRNPHLSARQRADLLRSYGNYLLDPPVSLGPVVRYLRERPGEDVAVRLAGLEALALPGTVKGPGTAALVLAWLDEREPRLRLAAIRAAQTANLTQAGFRLALFVGDATRPLDERIASARALQVFKTKKAVGALSKSATERATPPALRLEALRALAATDPSSAREPALACLSGADADILKEAVQILGSRVQDAKTVGALFLARKLPRELLSPVTAALQKHADRDPAVGQMLGDIMRSGLLLSLSPAELSKVRSLVAEHGNPAHGRELFLDSHRLTCINCHKLEGVGGNVGPDLTRVWDTHSVEKIVESMAEPSKEIKEGYQTFVATTTKGEVFTGLKVSQTADEVVLRDADAKEIHVAAKDLDELVISRKSLMPESAVSQLSFNEFIDLVAFLRDRPAQESLQGAASSFWVAGPFPNDLTATAPPEAAADPTRTYDMGGRRITWQERATEPNGLLNLRATFGQDPAAAYSLTYAYAPRAQSAQLLLGSDGGLRAWVNGRLIHEQKAARPAKPDDDRVDVMLEQGWNPILLKATAARAEHGVYLRIAGAPGLRIAARPDSR